MAGLLPFIHPALICFISVCLSAAQQTLVAKYNMGGVTGTVRFTQNSPVSPVDIVLQLQGLRTGAGFSYQLELHEFRVNYDTADRCSTSSIGNR